MKGKLTAIMIVLAVSLPSSAFAINCYKCEDDECKKVSSWWDYATSWADCEVVQRCILWGAICWDECVTGIASCNSQIALNGEECPSWEEPAPTDSTESTSKAP